MIKKSNWSDAETRHAQLDKQVLTSKTAYYGFKQVSSDEKSKRVVRHFNRIADKYDLMNTILSFGIHHQWKRTAINLLNLGDGDRVLDVCGGTGDLALLAGRVVGPGGQVIVYDINRSMIDVGRHKVSDGASGKHIRFVIGDAEHVAFADKSFEAAMVGFGIRNVPRMDQGFKEMYRILKPGGKIMCLEFSKPTAPLFRQLYDIYSFHVMPLLGGVIVGSRKAYMHLVESIRTFVLPGELTAMIEQVGFSQVTTRNLTNGIAVIHMAVKD